MIEIRIDKERAQRIKKMAKKAGFYQMQELLAKKLKEAHTKAELHEEVLPSLVAEIIELCICYTYQQHGVLDSMSLQEHAIGAKEGYDWIEDLRLKFEHNEDDAAETKAQDAADAGNLD